VVEARFLAVECQGPERRVTTQGIEVRGLRTEIRRRAEGTRLGPTSARQGRKAGSGAETAPARSDLISDFCSLTSVRLIDLTSELCPPTSAGLVGFRLRGATARQVGLITGSAYIRLRRDRFIEFHTFLSFFRLARGFMSQASKNGKSVRGALLKYGLSP